MDADGSPSRTAVLVAQGRAVADGRIAVGRFSDPTAIRLLREAERRVVEQVRAGEVPEGSERIGYELLRACGDLMVPRTVAIDDAVRARPNPQLVILGAGLDGRIWRMPELAATAAFEVDHPATQADKRDRLGRLSPTAESVRFVPVDFADDDLRTALTSAGHDAALPTTWIWEGVVSYLRRASTVATVEAVRSRSAPGSRLIVSYQAPSRINDIGRRVLQVVAALSWQPSPWAGEPHRASWSPVAFGRLLTSSGFVVGPDNDLLTIAERLSLAPDSRSARSLTAGRIAVAHVP